MLGLLFQHSTGFKCTRRCDVYHSDDTKSSMQLTYMLHELDQNFASVDHRVNEDNSDLVLKTMAFDVMWPCGMHEHSEWESIGDAIGYGPASTHESGDRGVLFAVQAEAVSRTIENVWDAVRGETMEGRQVLDSWGRRGFSHC